MDKNQSRESHLRSILKGFTWRILATTTTILVAYGITGQTDLALKIGAIEFFTKLLVYYAHERAWLAVPPGTIRSFFGKKNKE